MPERASHASRAPAAAGSPPPRREAAPASAWTGRTENVIDALGLLERLTAGGATGALRLEHGAVVAFSDGFVLPALEEPAAVALLADDLLATGAISRRDAASLRGRAHGTAAELLARLVETRAIDADSAQRSVSALVSDAVAALLNHSGAWSFEAGPPALGGDALPIFELRSSLVDLVAHAVPLTRTLAAFGGDLALIRLSAWPDRVLRPEQQPFAARLDGRTSFADAAALSGLGRHEAAAAAAVLVGLGFAAVEGFASPRRAQTPQPLPIPTSPSRIESPPEPPQQPPQQPPPNASWLAYAPAQPWPGYASGLPTPYVPMPVPTLAPYASGYGAMWPMYPAPPLPYPPQPAFVPQQPPPPATTTPPTDLGALRRRIRDADYFEVLGVGRDASADEIARAYAELRASIQPSLFAGDRTLAAETRAVLAVLDEAAGVLRDPRLRAAYRRNLAR